MRNTVCVALVIACLIAWTPHANAILDVPLYLQCDDPWGDDHYDSSNRTICRLGCALTCCVMVLRYYGVTQGPKGQDVNPGTLNIWLKDNHGYVRTAVNWTAVSKFSQLAKNRNNGNSVRFVGKTEKPKTQTQSTVDADLAAGKPVILHVKNAAHFVVATGRAATIYYINDPADCSDSLLYYSNTWQGIRRFARASGCWSSAAVRG